MAGPADTNGEPRRDIAAELRTYASGEARLLADLQSTLDLLRSTDTEDTFDEVAIWKAVESSLWADTDTPSDD